MLATQCNLQQMEKGNLKNVFETTKPDDQRYLSSFKVGGFQVQRDRAASVSVGDQMIVMFEIISFRLWRDIGSQGSLWTWVHLCAHRGNIGSIPGILKSARLFQFYHILFFYRTQVSLVRSMDPVV